MSQMHSLACSVYFYFPTWKAFSSWTELIFINPVFLCASSWAPCPGRGSEWTRWCLWRSRSSKDVFVPACKEKAASSAHILGITLLALKLACARWCRPRSLSPDIFFLFLLCLYKSKNWQPFFYPEKAHLWTNMSAFFCLPMAEIFGFFIPSKTDF